MSAEGSLVVAGGRRVRVPAGAGRADRRPDRRRRPLCCRLPLRPVARLSARGLRPARLARGGRGDLTCRRAADRIAQATRRPGGSCGLSRPTSFQGWRQSPRALQRVARLPDERNAPLGDAGDAAEIEARPRQERVAPPVGPDLDAHRRARREAARVEADGVGDDQRVGGHREGARRAQTPSRSISARVARSEPRAASRVAARRRRRCSARIPTASRFGVSRCEPGT